MNQAVQANNCPQVKMTTNHGDILLELFCDKAPITTKNFIRYVEEGFYNNTIFHRVIPGFVIQGGGFEPGMNQKDTHPNIENEADNGEKNLLGSLSMARTPDPHSASSQFFINLKDNDMLDFRSKSQQGWGYAVFAKVVKGIEVVEKIATVNTGNSRGHQDVPMEDVIVTSAEVINP